MVRREQKINNKTPLETVLKQGCNVLLVSQKKIIKKMLALFILWPIWDFRD